MPVCGRTAATHSMLTTQTRICHVHNQPIISGYINNLSLRSIDAGKFWARSAIRHSMLRSSGTMATSDSQLITAADNIVHNGEQIASDMILQYEGMLFKRQRGQSLKKGSGNRTKLKFQPRFCVLNNTGFMYKPKKSDKSKVCLANNSYYNRI